MRWKKKNNSQDMLSKKIECRKNTPRWLINYKKDSSKKLKIMKKKDKGWKVNTKMSLKPKD